MTSATQTAEFRPRLYFLVGPTAVGKTALSLAAAEALGAEILSCDSLCVYRRMDLGTAKPTAAERAAVPHHGIDLVPPAERYSIDAYTAYARSVMDQCAGRRRHVLVVGGSGFYLKSFFAPVTDGVEVPAEIAERVEALHRAEGLEGLLRALAPYDPEQRATLDRRNPRRVAKALERCLGTGRSLPDLQAAYAALPEPFAEFRKQVCLLQREGEELRCRVRQRVEQMFADGLLEEVRALREAGIERNPSAAQAIGYRETLAFLRSGRPASPEHLVALREEIAVHTDQLIRKQRIWFRRQIPIHTRVEAATATVAEAFPPSRG